MLGLNTKPAQPRTNRQNATRNCPGFSENAVRELLKSLSRDYRKIRPGFTETRNWRHYLAVVQRKPGALRSGAPFAELPNAFRTLQQYLLKKPGGDREMVDILALVLQHDEQAVLSAVDMALKSGVPTKTHVLTRCN
ncbi:transposase NmoT [Shinella sp. DD12]|nr:transposase NmoT [Shinella sp. DD12]